MKITVATPSFRQLAWLRLCAASVADQRGAPVEHIVQDADSGPEMEAWLAAQTSLKGFIEKDDGMYDAVNRALAKGDGEICAYLNCDEQYLPGALAKVLRWFEAHPHHDLLFSDAVLTDSGCRPFAYRRVVRPAWIHTCTVNTGTLSCAMFFRRTLWEASPFDPSWKENGDLMFVRAAMKAGAKMGVLPEPLAAFSFTGQNMSAGTRPIEESERRHRLPDNPPRWLEKPAVALHRLRKWLSGAYRERTMDIALYTPDSGPERHLFRDARLGYRWPEA